MIEALVATIVIALHFESGAYRSLGVCGAGSLCILANELPHTIAYEGSLVLHKGR